MVAQSSSNHSLNEKQNCASSNCLISLPFSIPPIFKQHSKSNLQLLTMAENSSNAVRHLQDSIASAVDKCFRLVHSIVSHHPLGNKLLNLSSQFQDFCQVRCRTYQNMGNLSHQNFAAILPGDSVAGVVVANGVLNFLNLYNTLLVVRLVLTWFPNAPPAIVSPLSTICDPYLNIFRGLIPPLGGTLDLSPILAFLLLNALTSTASALPAELPSTATTTDVSSNIPSHTPVSHLTTSQKKWMRRLAGNKSENAESKS